MAARVPAFRFRYILLMYLMHFNHQEEGKDKRKTQAQLPTRLTISNCLLISRNQAAPGYKGVGRRAFVLGTLLPPIKIWVLLLRKKVHVDVWWHLATSARSHLISRYIILQSTRVHLTRSSSWFFYMTCPRSPHHHVPWKELTQICL